jgi:hypothetical protein
LGLTLRPQVPDLRPDLVERDVAAAGRSYDIRESLLEGLEDNRGLADELQNLIESSFNRIVALARKRGSS